MNIYKKLYDAKKEIGAITKDSKNPFFKSSYFDVNSLLKEVEPILDKHNLLLIQPIQNNKVVTTIVDIDKEDSSVVSEMELPIIQDPQKLGSAITYYRRYTLQSLLGLQAEDDDGNKASKPVNINDNNRNPAITDNELKKLKNKDNYKHIDWFLANRRMTPEQRKGLEGLKQLM